MLGRTLNQFFVVVNDMAPIKEIRIKQRTELWINNEIINSIKERDQAFREFKKRRTGEKFSVLKTYGIKLKVLSLTQKRIILNKN